MDDPHGDCERNAAPRRRGWIAVLLTITAFVTGLLAEDFLFPAGPEGISGRPEASGSSVSEKLTGAISQTFRDMTGSAPERRPLMEIPLDENTNETQDKNGEAQNTSEIQNTDKTQSTEYGTRTNPERETQIDPPDCVRLAGERPTAEVILNEVAWMGRVGDPAGEWLELKNATLKEISLRGWRLEAGEGLEVVFGEEDVIHADGYFLLERTDDSTVLNVSADRIYKGGLPNEGTALRLFNADCGLADEADASLGWPAGDNGEKRTMERNSADLGWHTSAESHGTPGRANSEPSAALPPSAPVPAPAPAPVGTPPSAAPAFLRITEVMAGKEDAAAYEFVELWNPGTEAVPLTGWTVRKRTASGTEYALMAASRLEGKSIPAGRHFLLANEGGYAGSVAPDAAWATSNTLAYASNAVVLYDAAGQVAAEVSWTEIPKGQSYADNGSGFVIQAVPDPENSGSD